MHSTPGRCELGVTRNGGRDGTCQSSEIKCREIGKHHLQLRVTVLQIETVTCHKVVSGQQHSDLPPLIVPSDQTQRPARRMVTN